MTDKEIKETIWDLELKKRINEKFKEKKVELMRDIAINETRKKMFEIFKNFLRMELTAQQSDLTEEEAMEMAKKINKGIYERIMRGEEEREGEG